MNFAELKKSLKEGLSSLYYFYGEEVYLLSYMKDKLTQMAVASDFAEFNHLTLTGGEVTPDKIADFFEAYPVMSERKLLHIKDASVFTSKGEAFIPLLSDIPDYVTVLICEGAPDKRSKAYKELSKKAKICEFSYLERPDIKSHILKKLSSEKKEMSSADMDYLLDLTGPDLTNIRLQTEKLIAFSGERSTITRADIDKNITPPLLSRVYDISEAVISKNSDYALKLLSDLKKSNESALWILSILGSYFQELYRAYVLSRENMSYADMVSAMNLPPARKFVADKMFKRVKNVNPDFLRECMTQCTYAENQVKSGFLSDWQALELSVLKFLNY